MKTHPVKGALIMGQIPQLKEVVPGIKHHHEKWDGSGYPDGLAGEAIPIAARIIAVANSLDAMTTDRVYKAATTPQQAFEELVASSGTRYDPMVIRALSSAWDTIRPRML